MKYFKPTRPDSMPQFACPASYPFLCSIDDIFRTARMVIYQVHVDYPLLAYSEIANRSKTGGNSNSVFVVWAFLREITGLNNVQRTSVACPSWSCD